MHDRPSASHVVGYAAKQIADRHGALRIGALCDEIGISRKHLITLFRRTVGCAPKELARLHRFGHTLESIDVDGPVDWTAIAHENDYFDQSHFSRDFEAYTGLNPGAYLRLRRRAHARQQDGAAILGVLPAG
jgi:AraC-like DNA-binding protein